MLTFFVIPGSMSTFKKKSSSSNGVFFHVEIGNCKRNVLNGFVGVVFEGKCAFAVKRPLFVGNHANCRCVVCG